MLHTIIGGTNTITNNLEFYGKISKFNNQYNTYKFINNLWIFDNKFKTFEDATYHLNPYKLYDVNKTFNETIYWNIEPVNKEFYIQDSDLLPEYSELDFGTPFRIIFNANTKIISGFEYSNPINSISLYSSVEVIKIIYFNYYQKINIKQPLQ